MKVVGFSGEEKKPEKVLEKKECHERLGGGED